MSQLTSSLPIWETSEREERALMRVLVRTELDHNKPINLKKLTPYEKVKAGIVSQIRQNSFYLKLKRQKEEEEYLKNLKEDETLKSLILAELYAESK